MKHFLCILITLSNLLTAQPDWENPAIFSRDQAAPHAPVVPYESVEAALGGDPASSARVMSLDGVWKFHWAEVPEKAPAGFESVGYDIRDWDEIRVPSNWQMKGFGHAKFRNIPLTFPSDPPRVPDYYNPVGSYKRRFELPAGWGGNPVYLRFEGVKSASTVWINGQEVGYNQGGMEPAEYEVSSYLKPGINDIAVQVIRFSDGTYLENQDMWRLSGIYQSVSLYTVPDVHMYDYFVYSDFDDNFEDAMLHLEVELQNNRDIRQSVHLRYRLLDREGEKPVFERISSPVVLHKGESRKKVFREDVKSPRQWSSEYPNLYLLTLELLDDMGKVLEAYARKIGFRETEVREDGGIYVNGVLVKFNGVNSHQHHPETGRLVDEATIRKDFEIMKRFNINLVRTSHYPPSTLYLELANEYGLYVVDETNDECHQNIYLSSDPAWRDQFVDRMTKMVYRDRNQPCIVFWSAGNETGRGSNMDAIIREGKRLDPSRPYWMCGENDYSLASEDIAGPRYWVPIDLKNMLHQPIADDPRPLFMDEYLSVAGNALGGMEENWALIRKYPRHTGGAIWDWVSPSIKQPLVFVVDESANANHGLVLGRAGLEDGRHGKGLSLSGNDEWVDFYRSRPLDIEGPLTLEFWIKPGKFLHSGNFVMKSHYQYGLIQPDADTVEFYIYDGVNEKRISATAAVPSDWVGQWHHLAGIFDGDTLRLYVDRELRATVEHSGRIMNAPFSLSLGHDSSLKLDSYTGQTAIAVLDDLRIYDQVLEPDQLSLPKPVVQPVLDVSFDKLMDTGEKFFNTGGGRTYGLVWADRTIQPELWQVKKTPQPVSIKTLQASTGRFLVTNHHHFKNLKELDALYKLVENGNVLKEIPLELDLAPGESEELLLDELMDAKTGQSDLWLEFSFRLPEDMLWANKGHEVAWEQFLIHEGELPDESRTPGKLRYETNDSGLIISGDGFAYRFDTGMGNLSGIEVDGVECLFGPPEFSVWRAPLANDQDPWSTYRYAHLQRKSGLGTGTDAHHRTFGIDSLEFVLEDMDLIEIDEGQIRIDITQTAYVIKGKGHAIKNTSAGFENRYQYHVHGDGSLEIELEVIPQRLLPDWLPRTGLKWDLDKAFDTIKWYGRGPFENYPDRKTGARVSVYEMKAGQFYVPYLIPQDHGNRSDVRWVEVRKNTGTGLRFSSDELFNFSIHNHSLDNLDRANWQHQLKELDQITLNTDFEVTGLGDSSSGPLTAYRVQPGRKQYQLRIELLRK